MSLIKETIIEIVNEIPIGQVSSYGVVAKQLLSRTRREVTARLVWRMLSWLSDEQQYLLPWWRVVNKQGYISSLKLGERGLKQITLLEKENNPIMHGYLSEPRWYLFE